MSRVQRVPDAIALDVARIRKRANRAPTGSPLTCNGWCRTVPLEGCARLRRAPGTCVLGNSSAMPAHAVSHVYFGLNAMWVATSILAITYATIMSEKVNRAIVALIGACAMVIVGVLDQEEAFKGIDWNTI